MNWNVNFGPFSCWPFNFRIIAPSLYSRKALLKLSMAVPVKVPHHERVGLMCMIYLIQRAEYYGTPYLLSVECQGIWLLAIILTFLRCRQFRTRCLHYVVYLTSLGGFSSREFVAKIAIAAVFRCCRLRCLPYFSVRFFFFWYIFSNRMNAVSLATLYDILNACRIWTTYLQKFSIKAKLFWAKLFVPLKLPGFIGLKNKCVNTLLCLIKILRATNFE